MSDDAVSRYAAMQGVTGFMSHTRTPHSAGGQQILSANRNFRVYASRLQSAICWQAETQRLQAFTDSFVAQQLSKGQNRRPVCVGMRDHEIELLVLQRREI